MNQTAGKSVASFASQQQFRAWLQTNHAGASELLVRCYKAHAKERGLTYPQALDEALCFGWIDGVRRAIDDESFCTRFTPRKPKSKWSAVNTKRATELLAEGRMHPAGVAAFTARELVAGTGYSYQSRPTQLDERSLAKLKRNERAWAFFQEQPPWYQRTSSCWVMEAKREETRERRLAELIARSARGEPIKALAKG